MNCPVCQRSLAPTLSICPACGTMMNDSVREELESKISSGRLMKKEVKSMPLPKAQPALSGPAMPKLAAAKKSITANLVSHKTSPTLVEFQSKKAVLPDWRIQLQNAVQQRKGGNAAEATAAEHEVHLSNQGNLALKAEAVAPPKVEAAQKISDPRVANAMRRINESCNNFFTAPAKQLRPSPPVQREPARPFGIVSPNQNGSAAAVATAAAPMLKLPKPQLVSAPPIPKKRDTNKLPQIETIVEKPVIERVEKIESRQAAIQFPESKRIHIPAEIVEIDDFETHDHSADEIEDLAPFSMRFGAGLFDVIIGGFATMLILSPLAFASANWFTAGGLLTFAGTWAIVTFIYLTSCLGFFGKTMGMRLFQLELVDAVENEYPTLRQAAVNSSVFLVTMAFAGAGFVTVFFNEEKRALHDLVSGTILVREF